jgi:hypothetical protein
MQKEEEVTLGETQMFTRTLEYTLPGAEAPRSISVSVSAPEPAGTPGGDFRVLVEITGFAEPYKRHHYGVDEIQAILLGFRIVPVLVESMAEPDSRVTWLGSEDLGFWNKPYKDAPDSQPEPEPDPRPDKP